MIEIKNLTKTYGNVSPFKDLTFTIKDGDVITLIGPSGTGKSTLLRCINGLETPTSGEIYYNGLKITGKDNQLPEVRKHVGMVFQSFNLFPHMTCIENIMSPQIEVLKRSKQEAYEKAVELLKTVGLYNKAMNYPDQLSGGQKQRIAIARTLAMDCDVILMDEPTSALDPMMVGEVKAVMKQLAKSGKTMLIVTHDMQLAKDVSNRIIFLCNSSIGEDGTPDQIFNHPKNDVTRRFVNRLKVLELHIDSPHADMLETMSKIEQFASDVKISTKFKDKVIACYEEIVLNNLLPNFKKVEDIKVAFEYNSTDNEMSITIMYKGEQYNPCEDKDDLSMKFVYHYAKEVHYIFDGQNNIRLIVKE